MFEAKAKQNSVTAAIAPLDGEMIIGGHKKRRQVIKRATNGQKPTRPAVRYDGYWDTLEQWVENLDQLTILFHFDDPWV